MSAFASSSGVAPHVQPFVTPQDLTFDFAIYSNFALGCLVSDVLLPIALPFG
jgi:hypothetical protein